MSSFAARLSDMERYWVRKDNLDGFVRILQSLEEEVVPLLQRFPALGRRFLNTRPDTVHALLAYEKLADATESASIAAELREYVFDDHVLLYLLADDTIYLVSIRHCKEVSFEFDYLWGAQS
ncbi:hypothetical protein BTHE68_07120 [Burkholderia sp. THE68]|nr:hypothetical protein BTHE68_07120 [Burkholderia sp. THE68]